METTIYPAPPPTVPQPSAQPPTMTKQQMRQMERRTTTNETGIQAYNGYILEEVVRVREPDDPNKRMSMSQYRALEAQQSVYIPRIPSEFQQPVYQQPPIGSRECAASQQLPVYVHKRDLGEVPGYEGYSITPKRKIVRPDRVFAQVDESPMPEGGPRVRLPRAESSPPHLRDHNGGIPRFNSDVTPTCRRTDDGSNNDNRSDKGYDLANEFQHHRRRHHITARAGSGNANDGRYRQHQTEFYSSNGRNANQSRELDEVEEEERIMRAIKRDSRDRRHDLSFYSARNSPRRQQETPAKTLPTTNATLAPTLNFDNFNLGTTVIASDSPSTDVNTTVSSPRGVAPTPARRPTVEDLSFAPAATSPVRTYDFPYAPTTSSGQPFNLPGPRTNPLSSVSECVARGDIVPSDTMNPHSLTTQSVVSQMEANARAAAAAGRGEITYMDRRKYWVERKKAENNAWEMEGWKVGGGGERAKERQENSFTGESERGQEEG